ncbi:MAG: GerMN domain-containing protein, partial [Pyrinomonadaceae bacterium]
MKIVAMIITLACLLVPATFGQSPTMTVKLYYPNTKRDSGDCSVKVYPVTRKIPKSSAVAKAALEQLFAGPTSEEKASGYYSDFSDATKSFLISVNLKNRAA